MTSPLALLSRRVLRFGNLRTITLMAEEFSSIILAMRSEHKLDTQTHVFTRFMIYKMKIASDPNRGDMYTVERQIMDMAELNETKETGV